MRNYFKTLFKERYPYPIAYTDGTISRLKSIKEGRTAVGFIVKGYIITFHPVEVEAKEAYCYNKVVKNTGCFSKLPPLSVMKKVMRNVKKVNEIIKDFNGTPFESKWYGAENDRYLYPMNHTYGGNIIKKVIGIHPFISRSNQVTFLEDKVVFYPAIRVYPYW